MIFAIINLTVAMSIMAWAVIVTARCYRDGKALIASKQKKV